MKWTEPIQAEITGHLFKLGLDQCPICEGKSLGVAEKPVLMVSGAHPGQDADTITDYMVRAECAICGYIMLFNSEQFRDGDTPMLERR
jgi:hypothetical protein